MKNTSASQQWDQRYQNDGFFYGSDPNDFLREHSSVFPKNGRILSLAEGEGRNAIFLAKQGFSVTAVDWSAVGLEKLRDWAHRESLVIETICADISEFDFGRGAWDAIVGIWFHLPSASRREIYAKLVPALKAGGVLMLESYSPRQLQFKTGGPSDPDMLLELSEVQTMFASLSPVVQRELERSIQEGQGHCGLSSVTQYLGIKSPEMIR